MPEESGRSTIRTLLGVVLSLALVVPFAASADTTTTTLYLHSVAPVSGVETVANFAGAPVAPAMSAEAPTTPASKSAASSAGNPDFRKNFLLAWWQTPLNATVESGTLDIHVSANAGVTITASLFGDGGVGVGSPIGRASKDIETGPQLVQLAFPAINAAVATELVLSIDFGAEGGAVLYDSTTHPSALTLTTRPYVTPPPLPLPGPTAGWDGVETVNSAKTNRESSLAINPANENEMLMCTPSGVPATGEGHSYFDLSTDGGQTWNELQNEAEASLEDQRAFAFEGGDCDVAYGADGTMYTADTWLGNLSVGASRNGGATWTGTALAGTSPVVDRPWLDTTGPAGTIHITYQDVQFGMPSAIWYVRSTDFGKTFTPSVPVATADESGAFSWTGNFVVSPDGQDLYSVYTKRQGPAVGSLDAQGPETVWIAESNDGGATWSKRLIASTPNPASYLYPAIGRDAAGGLHVVFSSRRTADRPIWYSYSGDDAQTWTAPVPVSEGASGWSPWVAGGAAGEAVIQWLGSPDPAAALNQNASWYLYAGRVTGAGTGSQQIASAPTTVEPLFIGKHDEAPEFNMVRLDSSGKMRIGASVKRATSATASAWTTYFQREL